jgi:DNA-binding response OmpR family regulator
MDQNTEQEGDILHKAVLFIEPDKNVQSEIRHHLQGDFKLHFASTTKDGFAEILTTHRDLLLCDTDLGDLQVKVLLRQLQQASCILPFALFVKKGSAVDAAYWMKNGALDYIPRQGAWESKVSWKITHLLEQIQGRQVLQELQNLQQKDRQLHQNMLNSLPGLVFLLDKKTRVRVSNIHAKREGILPGALVPHQFRPLTQLKNHQSCVDTMASEMHLHEKGNYHCSCTMTGDGLLCVALPRVVRTSNQKLSATSSDELLKGTIKRET